MSARTLRPPLADLAHYLHRVPSTGPLRRNPGCGLLAASLAALVVMAVLGVAVASLLGLRGSSSDDPRHGIDANHARFTYGDRMADVPLVGCGRDGDIVAMAGRANGMTLQVAADLSEGGEARSGVTLDRGGEDGTIGAFGEELQQGPVGEFTDVRREGDALVVEGRWALLDSDTMAPAGSGATLVDGELVARCPPEDID